MAETPNTTDTAAAATPTPAAPPAPETKAKSKKPETELVKLQHEVKGNWTLRIDASEYAVVDGAVEVPAWHYDAAHQAGFR